MTRNVMTQPHTPDHTVEIGVSIAGTDWTAVAGYDVLSTPSAGTLEDPPEDLEIDVWALTLVTYYGEDGAITMPPGVNVDPMSVDDFDRIEQACIDQWHEMQSPGALADDAADRAYDARKDGGL